MAQHISIIQNNLYPTIQESIIKRFAKKNIGLGSFLYKELKSFDYLINSNDRVFLNERKINGKKEIFEIHFDIKQNKVAEIFWVK